MFITRALETRNNLKSLVTANVWSAISDRKLLNPNLDVGHQIVGA